MGLHEVLKHSPGLMGTVVERVLVTPLCWLVIPQGSPFTLYALFRVLDASNTIPNTTPSNPTKLNVVMVLLEEFLARGITENYNRLMEANLAVAGGHLDAFRVLRAVETFFHGSDQTAAAAQIPKCWILRAFNAAFDTFVGRSRTIRSTTVKTSSSQPRPGWH